MAVPWIAGHARAILNGMQHAYLAVLTLMRRPGDRYASLLICRNPIATAPHRATKVAD
jgi:hypothetical protein